MVTVKGLKKNGLFGKTVVNVPYEAGMTAGRVMERAGVAMPLPGGSMVTVDGKPVTAETPVADYTIVVFTPPVENG